MATICGSRRFDLMMLLPEVADAAGQVEDGLTGQVALVHVEGQLVLPVAGPVLELDENILGELVLEQELQDGAVTVEAGGMQRQPLLHRLDVDELGELLEEDLNDVLLAVVGGNVEWRVFGDRVDDGPGTALWKNTRDTNFCKTN